MEKGDEQHGPNAQCFPVISGDPPKGGETTALRRKRRRTLCFALAAWRAARAGRPFVRGYAEVVILAALDMADVRGAMQSHCVLWRVHK